MAESDIQLLTRCADFALDHIHSVEGNISEALQTSGATRYVMGLRLCRLHRAVVAAGVFSVFESLLQARMGWGDNAFSDLDNALRKHGEQQLADRIASYRNAINALKHGTGKSHTQLLSHQSLEFDVRAQGAFFSEGDVSEVDVLVDADDAFLHLGSELISEVCAVFEAKEGVHL